MRRALMECGMLTFVNKYALNVHSQNGEDGIIAECVSRLKLTSGHAVEIGGNDGLWMSNTRNLVNQGWSGLFVEYDYNFYLKSKQNWAGYDRVRHQCSKVDGNNINAFVDERCDLLSIDTDGADYDIFSGLKARPAIVIVEIDSGIPPDSLEFNSDGAAGYGAMVRLGIGKGYFLLAHTGNMVFIDAKYKHLFPDVDGDPIATPELYFNRSWLREDQFAPVGA